MRGSRVAEAALRKSPGCPSNGRTSSVDSDSLHSHSRLERSPKVSGGGVASHGSQSNSTNPKKIGTRIADLESQLGLAQEELRSLKDQLASTETAKKAQFQRKSKKQSHVEAELEVGEKKNSNVIMETDAPNENECSKTIDFRFGANIFEAQSKEVSIAAAAADDDPASNDLALKNDDLLKVKIDLEEKEKEVEFLRLENESFRSQLEEKSAEISSAHSEISELKSKLNEALHELEKSKSYVSQLTEKLDAIERSKEEMDIEMKRLTVQTEQWRKAADEAATVLLTGSRRISERCGSKISERCGSMDTHNVNALDYGSSLTSIIDDSNDVFGRERRKVTGVRILGELWKRKGEK